ncbi:DUF4175 family protein [Polaribacter pacificus]|uniref:DUF4175 family protein n=1 Tax=Polaribacter pacificus TaxID=1775173 RepID=UPI001E2CC906|nr:DUF4175 family protein [Polaribacter pacificus]
MVGLQKGISLEDSSKLIGNHFPEINDKLTNLLQLKSGKQDSDLLLASIAQKSKEIQPIPFVKAVNFKTNLKYLKYAFIPVFIYFIIWITGNITIFESSLSRVIQPTIAFTPPAPFSFVLSNKNLQVVEGKSISVKFITRGKEVPSQTKIIFDEQSYFMQNNQINEFVYTFNSVTKPLDFYIEANGIRSSNYRIDVIPTPTIQNLSILLSYPRYLRMNNETINNTGNFTVPEGTNITWNLQTKQTDTVSFITAKDRLNFEKRTENSFQFNKTILRQLAYEISTSNKALSNFETLQFDIKVIPDAYPKLEIVSLSDSLNGESLEFAGRATDDYGIQKLELVYYLKKQPEAKHYVKLDTQEADELTFYEQFPGALKIEEGQEYVVFFRAFDNDAVNGSKKTLSEQFSFRKKTAEEIAQKTLEDQRKEIQNIEQSIEKQKKQSNSLKEIEQNLKNTKNINWTDKKNIDQFIKRQEQYKQMMLQQEDQLQQNLEQQPKDQKSIQEKKLALQQRIEELKKLEKEQKLLEELKKLAQSLNKEDLLKKVQKLSTQNKQQERSLERILELTKRFYVEQKTMQISEKLDQLAKKQEQLSQKNTDSLQEQSQIAKDFEELRKELNTLEEDNNALKEPMSIPDTKEEQDQINESLKQTQTPQQDKNQQKKNQQKVSKQLKQMSEKLQQAMMAMEGEMLDANIDSLKMILKNLLNFSFQQEDLMDQFSKIDVTHPDFGKELKKQHTLKTYFEHIDDSLYVLSMKLPDISVKIQADLTDAHYNIDQALSNLADNRFNNGVSNQQYVMTSVNNLADFLSELLDNMQQSKNSSSGKGKKGGKQFSLPDLIQKQQELTKQMKSGKIQQENKQGQEKNKGSSGGGEELDEKLYQIYQEQSILRDAMKESMGSEGTNNTQTQEVLKSMEELENEILEKGFNPGTIQRMEQLAYNLLKLEEASQQQGEDSKRKSKTNFKEFKALQKDLIIQKLFYNQTEILNRQSLPLQKIYKLKVQEYFKKQQEKSTND